MTTRPAHATASEVERLLRERLEPSRLEVVDDSAKHAGHAGAAEGSHFSVLIESDRFKGVARVARHRLVYDALWPLMTRGIHALAIDARAPHER
jgi:BolA family transcriptional regulator, general stress-responsive regulator